MILYVQSTQPISSFKQYKHTTSATNNATFQVARFKQYYSYVVSDEAVVAKKVEEYEEELKQMHERAMADYEKAVDAQILKIQYFHEQIISQWALVLFIIFSYLAFLHSFKYSIARYSIFTNKLSPSLYYKSLRFNLIYIKVILAQL